MLYIIIFSILLTSVNGKKDGHIASTLDEYFSTIKCVANIVEEVVPEFNEYLVCCGVWIMKDWFNSKVLDDCHEHNYHQINNMTNGFMSQMRKMCVEYPEDSFYCKILIIAPITFIVLFIIFIISIIACAIVSCVRLRKIKKQYRYHMNIREFDTINEEMTNEKKKIDL